MLLVPLVLDQQKPVTLDHEYNRWIVFLDLSRQD